MTVRKAPLFQFKQSNSATVNQKSNQTKMNRPSFYCNNESISDEGDLDEGEDSIKVLEESPSGRWNKLAPEIFIQKLLDFDTTHLGIGIYFTHCIY